MKKNSISEKFEIEKEESSLPLIGRSTIMQDVYRIMARLMGMVSAEAAMLPIVDVLQHFSAAPM